MDWSLVLNIAGLVGGITAVLALFLGPAFYVGAKLDKIGSETKDFHGRLCRLEEKYVQMMERFLEKRGK